MTIEIQNIGVNSFAAKDIDVEKLSFSTPESNNSYKPKDDPQGISVALESFTITITLHDTDKNKIAELLEEASSTNLTLSAQKEWIDNDNLTADKQNNISVTVSNNVAADQYDDSDDSDDSDNPELSVIGSTYDAATGILAISTKGYDIGASNSGNSENSFNVHPQRFTFLVGNQEYVLPAQATVTIVDSSTIQIQLNATDKTAISERLQTGTTYSLSADKNWATGEGFKAEDVEDSSLVISNLPVTDTSAPAAPAITTSGGFTNDTTPTIEGTAEAGTTVTLYEGDTALGSVLVGESGNWSITSAVLTNGTHALTVKAVDAAGNSSQASGSITVTIDTSAPAAPAITTARSITNDTTPTFIGTGESGATVTLFNDADNDGVPVSGELLGITTVTGESTWSFTPLSPLAQTSYNVSAIQTDIVGNVSAASESISITIDTTPPDITISKGAFSNDTGIAGDWITAAGTQIIAADLSAPLGTGDIVYGSVNNGADWEDITGKVTGTSLSWDKTLTESGTLKLKVTDSAGNDGSVLSRDYVLDQTKPNAPGSFSTPRSVTNDTTPAFIGSGENSASVTWRIQL